MTAYDAGAPQTRTTHSTNATQPLARGPARVGPRVEGRGKDARRSRAGRAPAAQQRSARRIRAAASPAAPTTGALAASKATGLGLKTVPVSVET